MERRFSKLTFPLVGPVLVMALVVVVHLPGLVVALSGDDFVHVYRNRLGLSDLPSLFAEPDGREYRPLVRSSLVLDHQLWGDWYTGYHVTNLLLHLVNGLLLLRWAIACGAGPQVALLAMAWFGLHPIHSYSIHAVMGRTDLLACAFLLLSAVRARRGDSVGAGIGALGAVLSKESGLVAPLVLIVQTLIPDRNRDRFPKSGMSRWKAVLGPVVVSVAVAVTYLLFRLLMAAPDRDELAPYLQFGPVSILRNLGLALAALAVPAGHLHLRSVLELFPAGLLWGAILFSTAAAIAFGWRCRNWLSQAPVPFWFGLGWTLVTLLPYLSLFQRRFLYAAGAGFCLAAATMFWRWGTLRTRLGIASLLVVVLAAASLQGSLEWRAAGLESAEMVGRLSRIVDRDPGAQWWAIDVPNGRGEAHLFTHDSLRFALGLKLDQLPAIHPVIRIQLASESRPRVERVGDTEVRIRITPSASEWFVFDVPELMDRGGRFLPVGTVSRKGPFRIEVIGTDSQGRTSELSIRWKDLAPRGRLLVILEESAHG